MVTSGRSRQSSRPFRFAGCGCLGLAHGGWREGLRNFVGVDRDQADRLLARQRAEPLLHLAGSEAIAARAHEIDADEVAVLGAAGIRWRDVQFAAGLLLVDGNEPAAAAGGLPEDAEQPRAGVIDHLDDAAAIERAVALIQLLDAHQRAVADAGGGSRLRAARHVNADFWRGAAFFRVPFGGSSEQFAVGVAAGDVGDARSGAGWRARGFSVRAWRRRLRRRVRAGCASARRGRHSSGRTRGRFPACRSCPDSHGQRRRWRPGLENHCRVFSSLIPGPCPRSSSQAFWVQWRASPPMSWRRMRPARAPC